MTHELLIFLRSVTLTARLCNNCMLKQP